MRRGYVNIGSEDAPALVHYRQSGQGPVLLMLHASPLSSAVLVPLITALSEYATVIAVDTPGYGYSDPLQVAPRNLNDYSDVLDHFCQGLGLSNFGLYGTATGAQIAIEYGKSYTDKVDYIILDNAADFPDEERDAMLEGYFPDLAPDDLGSHLMKTWSIVRDLNVFFPWHHHTESARIAASAVNKNLSNMLALEYLQAGEDYDLAYKHAFVNEKIERLLPLTIPTTIIRWEGSIVKSYVDRLDSYEWPDNFFMAHCGPAPEDRIKVLVDTVLKGSENKNIPEVLSGPAYSCQRPVYRFVDIPSGQFHLLEAGIENKQNLVLLHTPGESCHALSDVVYALSAHYHVVVPDLPGHGATNLGVETVSDMATVLTQLIDELNIENICLVADSDSAVIAANLGQQAAAKIDSLALLNPIDYSILDEGIDIDKWCPEFDICEDGTHLFKIWYMLRDKQLFWPWYERNPAHSLHGLPELNGDYLTSRLLDYWRARPVIRKIYEDILACPLKKHLAELNTPSSLMVIEHHPLAQPSQASFTGQDFTQLPAEVGLWRDYFGN